MAGTDAGRTNGLCDDPSAEPVIYRFLFGDRRVLRTGLAIGVGLALVGCSAHERGPAVSAAPAVQPQAVAVADVPAAPAQQGVPRARTAAVTSLPDARPVAISARPATADRKVARPAGQGLASWYGDRFHGRRTANGEQFDMAGFTAAHRSFPLPSYVRVTNVSNGHSIVVRVNDRGPFHGNRLIDVSRRAADVLGFRGLGVGNVKLDYIGKAPEGRSDAGRLLASYQEFGRPAAPQGMQVAMAPVSDGDLASEAGSGGGAFAIASAAVTNSAAFVRSSAASLASSAKTVASTATAAVRTILPGSVRQAPVVVAAVPAPSAGDARQATATAYAPPQPLIAQAPAAITDPQPIKAKRVILPGEPALASATPGLRTGFATQSPAEPSTGSGSDVSSRIASSFEGFGQTSVLTGASVSIDGLR